MLLAVALAVRFVDDGPAGAGDWMRAKFLGKTRRRGR